MSTKDVKNDLELLEKSLPAMNLNQYINENVTEYVYHPINAFHLMKRTTILWPEILENTLRWELRVYYICMIFTILLTL